MEQIFFQECDVTIQSLLDIFNTDDFSAERKEDTVLIKRGVFSPVYILIDEHSGALKFRTSVTIQDDSDMDDLLDFIHHINNAVTCCQFYLIRDDDEVEHLCGSAFLVIHFGIKLLELYFFVTAFSSAFAAGCRIASEHNLIDLRAITH